jgi:hypothetical protein
MVVACVQLAGCRKSGGAAAPVARDDLPTVLANAACDALGTCCQQAGATFDAAACSGEGSARLKQELDQRYGGPNVTYDPQAAGDCIAELSSATFCGAAGSTPGFDGCRDAFVGTLPPGAACVRAAECARPAQGQADCDLAKGVCVQQTTAATSPHGKAGDPCAGTCVGDNCTTLVLPKGAAATPWCYRSEGLACGRTSVCEPLQAKGAACSGFGCVEGSYCDFASSVCVETKANGQHCNSPYECQSGICVDPGTCAASPVTQQICTNGPLLPL